MRKKKRAKRALSMVLALAVTIGAVCVSPVLLEKPAQAITQADIDAMKEDIGSIASEIKDLENELATIQGDKAQALKQKQYLDGQITLLDQEIAQLDSIIADYDVVIAEREAEISELQVREENQYRLFCQRVRSMEEQGTVSYLSILFSASSFSELLDNAMLIGEIMDYDNEIIEMLQTTRTQIEETRDRLEVERADQQAMRDDQAASRATLQEQEKKAAQLVQQIASQESEYEAAIKELEAEDARIQREMQQAQRTLALQNISVVSESGWYWPVPGNYTLTSKFGWRIHPVYGTTRHHNGTDIAAPKNTPIGAAKSGVVTTSQYSSSYGNYVVVTHGNGYQTLYAHMTSRAVSVGDTVKQGQTLGYVGSTGVSTGNHLHYEVWVDGSRSDAEQYYSNLDSVFIRRY